MLSLECLEKVLPHWLEQTQLQWVRWVYAFWQFVGGNPLALLLLSVFPFYLRQQLKHRKVVVVGEAKDLNDDYTPGKYRYANMIIGDIDGEYTPRKHRFANMKIGDIYDNPRWPYAVEYNGYYYMTHQNSMCELSALKREYGEDVIFAERLLAVSRSLAVGKRLSQTEAYEKILSNRCLLRKGPKYVVPTCFDYLQYRSKFWGVLSTIPIFLQARNYNKCSTLLSLVIVVLDFFRGTLYKHYDWLFNCVTRFVKLNIFKTRTYLYDFFSIFSNRWRYSDPVKKYAYLVKPNEQMTIMWNCKLRSLEDIQILDSKIWDEDPYDYATAMALYPDTSGYKAECNVLKRGDHYSTAVLTRNHVYVP